MCFQMKRSLWNNVCLQNITYNMQDLGDNELGGEWKRWSLQIFTMVIIIIEC